MVSRAMTQASNGTAETTKTAAGRRSVKLLNQKLGRSYLSMNDAEFTRLLLGHVNLDDAVASGGPLNVKGGPSAGPGRWEHTISRPDHARRIFVGLATAQRSARSA